MSDREFIVEIKRGISIILRAMIRRYGLAWADFLPKDAPALVGWNVAIDETHK